MTQEIIIRRYKKEDIQQCIVMIEKFLIEDRTGNGFENHYKGIDIDKNKVYDTLTNRVNDIDFFGNLIVADGEIVGCLCAFVATPFYSNTRIAYDQLFYVKPEFTSYKAIIRLFKLYISWAEKRNVAECRMCSSTGFNMQGFTKLCQRLGFTQFEVGFSKGF